MEFNCKEFALNHSKSTMKVGTDSILLSSLIYYSYRKYDECLSQIPRHILDVGTGCGIISLCLAQIFSQSYITAIDIDAPSVQESKENFASSKWNNRMKAINISLEEVSRQSLITFDLIVSNPPYFTKSLTSSNQRKMSARHNYSLSLESFVNSGLKIISSQSVIAIILPQKESAEIEKLFSVHNIFPQIIYNIYSKISATNPIRRVAIFSYQKNSMVKEDIFIRNIDNQYTEMYKNLVSPFLL